MVDGCQDNNDNLDNDSDDDVSLFGSSVDGDKNGNGDNEEVASDAIAIEVEGHDTNVDITTEAAGNDGCNNDNLEDNSDDKL